MMRIKFLSLAAYCLVIAPSAVAGEFDADGNLTKTQQSPTSLASLQSFASRDSSGLAYVSGIWTNGFPGKGYKIVQSDTGAIVGSGATSCAPRSITGQVLGPRQFKIRATATSPGPEPCATWIDYTVTMTGINAGAASWTNSYGHTGSMEMSATLSLPTNFRQTVARSYKGLLQFRYVWDSTTGSSDDLAGCIVGEKVVYPGGSPFRWPDPFIAQTDNPTIISFSAASGIMGDIHSFGDKFAEKLKETKFSARQEYRFKCGGNTYVSFPEFSKIPIVRKIVDSTGRGCFAYIIQKSGARAFIDPLPGVRKRACNTAGNVQQRNALGADGPNATLSSELFPPPRELSLHEPAYLQLKVQNRSDESKVVDFGLNSRGNMRVYALYPSGRKVEGDTRRYGIGSPGEVSIGTNDSHSLEILLNEWFHLNEVGEYEFVLSLADGPSRTSSVLTTSTAKVRIVPTDWSRLRNTAVNLATTALGSDTLYTRVRATEALASMAHPAAVESLAKVARQSSLLAPLAIKGLGIIQSTEAKSALAAARRSQDPDVASAAEETLRRIDQQKNDAGSVSD